MDITTMVDRNGMRVSLAVIDGEDSWQVSSQDGRVLGLVAPAITSMGSTLADLAQFGVDINSLIGVV